MIAKIKEKEKAIKLRKQGLSYREILKEIPVAKSTLSLWLRSVELTERQKQRLTEKKLASIKRGAEVKKNQRIAITKEIKEKAIEDIDNIDKRDLRLIGASLYWAEGCKEKSHGCRVELGNSDPLLMKIYIKWLLEVCRVDKKDINFRIYLHETSKDRLQKVINYWSDNMGFPKDNFIKVTWKKNKIKTNRKNVGENYFGLLSATVNRSINLNRKIDGWIKGICKQCRVV